uniref:YEATS domain-containing protein 4 n=1 Tax=Aceria tosichella TaxID=561515 RepID=A0A6G1S6H0_9ACAR
MVETPLIKNKTSISEWGPDSGGRQRGVTIVKPIIYGNIARALPDTKPNNHTHEWTCYLRPYKNEDMNYVKKISFKLHESYGPNSEKTLLAPPFEVKETGWGEFEVIIKIYFVDPNERPVTIYHNLKLFEHDQNNPGGPPKIDKTKTIVSEHYDEIVFQDPSLMLSQILNAPPKPFQQPPYRHEVDFEAKAQRTMTDIMTAKKKARAEVIVLKDRLKKALETKAKLEDQRNKMSATS